MAGTRKRKHAANDDAQKPATQQDITLFGAMSKAKEDLGGMKKRKTRHQKEATPPPPPQVLKPAPAPQDKKRKRTGDEEDEAAADGENIFKRSVVKREPTTPNSKRFRDARPPTPAETPSRDTAALFDKLRLGSDTRAIPFSSGPAKLPDTPPRTPEAEAEHPDVLPVELQDLINLHSAFLSALSLYYSHNGTSSPVNVKPLLSMITKNWKKRAVTLDDLRKLLALQSGDSAFKLQDFGRAGICLIRIQPRGRSNKRAASFVDEVELSANFEDALMTAWLKSRPSIDAADGAASFVSQLSPVDIAEDESVEMTAPMFARGHQRLAELKAGQAAARREPSPTPDVQSQQKSVQATHNRGTNLLDRILAKQAHTASLPAGPTREQLERKAALHRIEDIARVLDLLAAGRARCSYSMPAMVQQLQQSLRNPISREEVERCLDLMATEITPGFVALVKNGAVTGVVVTRGGRVGRDLLKERVAAAVA